MWHGGYGADTTAHYGANIRALCVIVWEGHPETVQLYTFPAQYCRGRKDLVADSVLWLTTP